MFNPITTLIEALEQTGQNDRQLLTTASATHLCWHDPIAVELQRRLTEPLLRHVSTEDLVKLLNTQNIGDVINQTIDEYCS